MSRDGDNPCSKEQGRAQAAAGEWEVGARSRGSQQGRVAAAVCPMSTAQLSPPAQMPYYHHTKLLPQQYQKGLNQTPKF